MSGGGTTQQTSQNKDPWAPSIPYLTDIMGQGSQLYNSNTGGQTWGGPLVAPQAPQTQLGINSLTSTAQSQMPNAGQPLAYGQNTIANNGLTPAYSAPMSTYANVTSNAQQPTSSATNLSGMASGADAGQNPYLMSMLQDNANVIGNRVASQMSGAGRYGSAGMGNAVARGITAANAPILSGAYENDRNRMLSANGQIDASNIAAGNQQMGAAAGQTGILNAGQQNAAQWASMIPQLTQASYAPGNQMMALGDYQNAYQQKNIDAQRQLFEQQQAMPWTQLNRYSGAVSGLGGIIGQAGSMTGTNNTQKQLGFMDYLSPFGGGANSTASGVANAGSSVLGFLSDRNEKTDIKKIGEDDATGLGIYAYRYKGDPKTYPKMVGPMAQDVRDKFPGSTEQVGGKLYIKREAIGILGL